MTLQVQKKKNQEMIMGEDDWSVEMIPLTRRVALVLEAPRRNGGKTIVRVRKRSSPLGTRRDRQMSLSVHTARAETGRRVYRSTRHAQRKADESIGPHGTRRCRQMSLSVAGGVLVYPAQHADPASNFSCIKCSGTRQAPPLLQGLIYSSFFF